MKSFFTAALFAVVALPVSAGSQTYHCKFGSSANSNSRHWKANLEDVLVEADEDNSEFRFFNKYVGVNSAQPVAAKTRDLRNGKQRMNWKVTGLPGTMTRTLDDFPVSVTDVKITIKFRMDFSRSFEAVGYQLRMPGGSWWPEKTGRCRSLEGSIERYIKVKS